MRDRDFLIWIHRRLESHGESDLLDYMHKLRAIIRATPIDRATPNCNSCNSIDSLIQDMKRGGS